MLGLVDGALGHKEEAVRKGRRAVELMPPEKDSLNGSVLETQLAIINALCGVKDLAIEQLNANSHRPGDGSYGDLRLNPVWDPLRGDPRFRKTCGLTRAEGLMFSETLPKTFSGIGGENRNDGVPLQLSVPAGSAQGICYSFTRE